MEVKISLSSIVIHSSSTDETDFVALSSIFIYKFMSLDFLLFSRKGWNVFWIYNDFIQFKPIDGIFILNFRLRNQVKN